MSGRPGSNRRHSAWKADALPTELLPHSSKYIIFFYFGGVNLSILNITAENTLPIRQQMLRQGRPLSDCHFDKDKAPSTRHWGAFANEELVGILSAMENPLETQPEQMAFQFRGMAVIESYQRNGIASKLLIAAEKQLQDEFHPQVFWLNARVNAQQLYLHLDYQSTGDVFEIPTVGPHLRYTKHPST